MNEVTQTIARVQIRFGNSKATVISDINQTKRTKIYDIYFLNMTIFNCKNSLRRLRRFGNSSDRGMDPRSFLILFKINLNEIQKYIYTGKIIMIVTNFFPLFKY